MRERCKGGDPACLSLSHSHKLYTTASHSHVPQSATDTLLAFIRGNTCLIVGRRGLGVPQPPLIGGDVGGRGHAVLVSVLGQGAVEVHLQAVSIPLLLSARSEAVQSQPRNWRKEHRVRHKLVILARFWWRDQPLRASATGQSCPLLTSPAALISRVSLANTSNVSDSYRAQSRETRGGSQDRGPPQPPPLLENSWKFLISVANLRQASKVRKNKIDWKSYYNNGVRE